jgi:predicted transposase YdaD
LDKDYDSFCKRLFRKNPQAFLSLFEEGATFLHLLPEELPPGASNEEPQRVDCLMLALIEELETLVQIEWQSYNHYRMGDRLLDYNRKIEEQHKKTALPCVIYLLLDGNPPSSPLIKRAGNIQVHRFDFRSLHIGEWRAEDLLAGPILVFVALLPFTIGGRDRRLVKRMLEKLQQEGDEDLVNIGTTFAEYAFDHYHADLKWLKREIEKMKPLRELPFYKEMLEEGRAEGREEGLEEGSLVSLRNLLVEIVDARWPELEELAQEQADLIDKPEILHALTLKVALAKTGKQAERYLHTWHKPGKKQKSA